MISVVSPTFLQQNPRLSTYATHPIFVVKHLEVKIQPWPICYQEGMPWNGPPGWAQLVPLDICKIGVNKQTLQTSTEPIVRNLELCYK